MNFLEVKTGIFNFAIRLLIALVIILIASRVVRMVKKLMLKGMEKTSLDANVKKLLTTVAEVAIYTLAVFIAADSIGIPSASILALLGSAGLAIGLSD